MEKKFNVGDIVRLDPEKTKNMGYFGFRDKDAVIIDSFPEHGLYVISIGNKPISTSVSSDIIVMVEPYNQKTAFLTEFKDLMNKHRVRFGIDLENKDASFSFDDGEFSVFSEKFLKISTNIKNNSGNICVLQKTFIPSQKKKGNSESIGYFAWGYVIRNLPGSSPGHPYRVVAEWQTRIK